MSGWSPSNPIERKHRDAVKERDNEDAVKERDNSSLIYKEMQEQTRLLKMILLMGKVQTMTITALGAELAGGPRKQEIFSNLDKQIQQISDEIDGVVEEKKL